MNEPVKLKRDGSGCYKGTHNGHHFYITSQETHWNIFSVETDGRLIGLDSQGTLSECRENIPHLFGDEELGVIEDEEGNCLIRKNTGWKYRIDYKSKEWAVRVKNGQYKQNEYLKDVRGRLRTFSTRKAAQKALNSHLEKKEEA